MKYVIHHHTGHPTEKAHFDFMIEENETLLTWRLSENAMKNFLAGIKVFAQRIADHRKKYLTYEGPITCDRGMVKIVDKGECTALHIDENVQQYAIKGLILHGSLSIQKKKGATAIFCYIPEVKEKMH